MGEDRVESSFSFFCVLSCFPLTPITAPRETVLTGNEGWGKQDKSENKWQIEWWPYENRKKEFDGR